MSEARTAILGRLERAVRTGRIPEVRPPESLALRDVGSAESLALQDGRSAERLALDDPLAAGAHDSAAADAARTLQAGDARTALIDRFVLEARALGVDVFVEATAGEVRERLRALTASLRPLAWNPERLPYSCSAVVPDALSGSAALVDQARAEVGVTGCHGAIAETGSIALMSGPGCSRTVSLLPPFHIAVVQTSELFATMADFFHARGDAMARAANTTLVTGPSRTADIELTLTVGVHGPGRVAIIIGP